MNDIHSLQRNDPAEDAGQRFDEQWPTSWRPPGRMQSGHPPTPNERSR